MYKIAITGPESTGKTILAEKLANYFKGKWVKEFARAYLTERKGLYGKNDLRKILDGQLLLEKNASQNNSSFLFCDSDILVIYIWSKAKYNEVDEKIRNAWINQHYDLHLLLYPDLKWEYDPLRENKDNRHELFSMYQSELIKQNKPFVIIKGEKGERLNSAVLAINDFLLNN